MLLDGDSSIPSIAAVVDSTFHRNGNGEELAGVGIISFNAAGTIVRSSMNNNIGPDGTGFVAATSGEYSLIDVIANGNDETGITAQLTIVNVINSIACGNSEQDLFDVTTAQATTCDVSMPPLIGTLPVCQCSCGGSSGTGMSAVGRDGRTAMVDWAAAKMVIPAGLTVN
jgi:hypothetical protein